MTPTFDTLRKHISSTSLASIVIVGLCALSKVFDIIRELLHCNSSIGAQLLLTAHEYLRACDKTDSIVAKVQNLNYASAMIQGARKVTCDSALQRHTRLDVHKLAGEVDRKQVAALSDLKQLLKRKTAENATFSKQPPNVFK